MDATMSVNGSGNAVLLDATETNLIHMIDHAVACKATTYGPLPYSLPGSTPTRNGGTSSLPGDYVRRCRPFPRGRPS